MAKQSKRTVLIPLLLSIVSVILIALLFVAGSRPKLLNDFYFFETNTDKLNIPSRLNSSFLQALEDITGTQLTGKNANASTLKLFESYKIALLNACGQNSTVTKCSDAKLGFHFDALKNFSLSETGLRNTIPKDVHEDLDLYRTVSPFLAVAYIIAGALLLISPIVLTFSRRHPHAAMFSGVAALGGSVFLVIASIVAPAGFAKLVSALNKAFEPNGLKSKLGFRLFVVSWVATLLSMIGAIIIISGARSNLKRTRAMGPEGQSRMRPYLGKLSVNPRNVGAAGEQPGSKRSAMTPISAFMNRVPTWNRHQYTQIERQQPVRPTIVEPTAATRRLSADDDRELLVRGDAQHPTIEELEEEQGYALEAPRGIALHTLPGRTTRDADTVYEPYR